MVYSGSSIEGGCNDKFVGGSVWNIICHEAMP